MSRRRILLVSLVAWAALLLQRGNLAHANSGITVCASGCDYNSIQAAINAAAPDATITLASNTYVENLSLYDKRLTITGVDADTTILSGGQMGRVLFLYANTTLTLTNVTVRDGWVSDNQGGGIYSDGRLVLNASRIMSNHASLSGGGIANFGTLIINRSVITGNTVLIGNGGGIINGGRLTVTESTVAGNHARLYGGGVYNGVGTFNLMRSTISSNRVIGFGGGIANFDRMTSTNSTISNNSAQGVGGGIVNGGTLLLASVTLAENLASTSSGIYNSGAMTVENTIIANKPVGENCTNLGIVTSLGHNLDSGATCGFTTPADFVYQDARLGPLANNGGATQTQALLPDSPAIDTGSNDCPPPATDQRGIPRPFGTRCDIGAYESDQPLPFALAR